MTTAPTLVNYDDDTDKKTVSEVLALRQTVAHRPAFESRTDVLGGGTGGWDWEQLRDYVMAEITKRFGPQPQLDAVREASIFKGFISRHGATEAQLIAQYAFNIEDGRWRGAPISVNRFCKNSDSYFAAVIAKRLAE